MHGRAGSYDASRPGCPHHAGDRVSICRPDCVRHLCYSWSRGKSHPSLVRPVEYSVGSSHAGICTSGVRHAPAILVGQPPRFDRYSLLRDRHSGLLFFLEMSRGIVRRLLQILLLVELPICAAGVGAVLFTKSPYRFIHFSNVLVVLFVLFIVFVVAIPATAKKFGIQTHRISTVGFLVVGVAALYANLRGFVGLPEYRLLEPLAFAVLILSLGYVVAERIFTDGRRLVSIEKELAIAREIQTSILPTGVPEITSLNICAAYHPMAAVAGDFYEFIPKDEHRVGFLMADVSGHGVPAALIAAMIKVAMQSLVHCADRPGEVLKGLNR